MTKLKDKDRTVIDLTKIVMAQTGEWRDQNQQDRPGIYVFVGTHVAMLNYTHAKDRDHDYNLIANRDSLGVATATGAFTE